MERLTYTGNHILAICRKVLEKTSAPSFLVQKVDVSSPFFFWLNKNGVCSVDCRLTRTVEYQPHLLVMSLPSTPSQELFSSKFRIGQNSFLVYAITKPLQMCNKLKKTSRRLMETSNEEYQLPGNIVRSLRLQQEMGNQICSKSHVLNICKKNLKSIVIHHLQFKSQICRLNNHYKDTVTRVRFGGGIGFD